jgi:hypothetical protein
MERHDDGALMAALRQRPGERAGNIGQPARLRKPDDLGSGEQNLEFA